MKLSGLIFMLIFWCSILGMDIFCFYGILTKQAEENKLNQK